MSINSNINVTITIVDRPGAREFSARSLGSPLSKMPSCGTYTHMYVYIYIYREREREGKRDTYIYIYIYIRVGVHRRTVRRGMTRDAQLLKLAREGSKRSQKFESSKDT